MKETLTTIIQGFSVSQRQGSTQFCGQWQRKAIRSTAQYGEITTELVVNAVPRAKLHVDSEYHTDDEGAAGFVILRLNRGDVVFIRSLGGEGVLQHIHQQWSFSGWQIM